MLEVLTATKNDPNLEPCVLEEDHDEDQEAGDEDIDEEVEDEPGQEKERLVVDAAPGGQDVGHDEDDGGGDGESEVLPVVRHGVLTDGLVELTLLQSVVLGVNGLNHSGKVLLGVGHQDDEECQQCSMEKEVEDEYEKRNCPESKTTSWPHGGQPAYTSSPHQ